MEEWKKIKGFDDYIISNHGRVKSFKNKKERILKPAIVNGYYQIILCGEEQHYKKIHRLVAEAFIPNIENKPQINHINGIKIDNEVGNLEWCTISENSIHSRKMGLQIALKGESNANSKLTEKDVMEIRKKYIPIKYSSVKLSKEYGVSSRLIRKIIKRIAWNHI